MHIFSACPVSLKGHVFGRVAALCLAKTEAKLEIHVSYCLFILTALGSVHEVFMTCLIVEESFG